MILSPHLNSVQDLGTDGVLNWTTLLFVGLTVIQLSSHQVASAFNNVCNAFSLLAKITISSAYSRMQTFSLPISIPQLYDLMKVTRSCIYKLNNKGDKGHPCFRPVLTLNQSVRLPFILTEHCTLA